jgi:hypothetical protein
MGHRIHLAFFHASRGRATLMLIVAAAKMLAMNGPAERH